MMSQNKKLSIALYWHMHQPVYQLATATDYLMPWTRLHAIKDYLDMVEVLDKFKNIKMNFNLVPLLIDELIDYTENDLQDLHSRLTLTLVEQLTDDEKLFIINNFFDANYKSMILPNDEYNRLYQKRQTFSDATIDMFTHQEYSDLMALFNLVWFDPVYKEKYPELKKLCKKGKNYTYEDRVKIIEIQYDIMKKIIPAYKKYLDKGQIEITTSPYYHSILPILLDENNKIAKNPAIKLNASSDANQQVKMALDRIEEVFGKRPRGVWPSEHCIDSNTLNMLSDLGVEWTISDESTLSASTNHEFVRDFKGHLEDPYRLVKTYKYKTGEKNIKIVFRDGTIPNLIGFEYANYDAINAANDLYDRIKVIQSKLLASPDDNHLLTIAMDGENCWENYPDDGNLFLKTFYNLIEKDKSLETVLLSDYLAKDRTVKNLSKVSAGSWINHSFKLWIDEPLKDLAWEYVSSVREDLQAFVKRNPNHPNIELARKELFICEGSDWFWWYGEPNSSGKDDLFDYIFREHLKNVYSYLDLEYPKYLDEPLTASLANPSRYPKGSFTPALDGDMADEAWLNAGCIDIPDGPVLRNSKLFDKICYGYDAENFYVRFYLNNFITENQELSQKTYQMYIYTKNATRKHALSPVRLINKTDNILPVLKDKFHNEIQISIQNNEIKLVRMVNAISNSIWALQSSKNIRTIYNNTVDLSIPFELLDTNHGDMLEFIFIIANYGMTEFVIPSEMLLNVPRL